MPSELSPCSRVECLYVESIPSEELVNGDLLILRPDMRLPCDILLLRGSVRTSWVFLLDVSLQERGGTNNCDPRELPSALVLLFQAVVDECNLTGESFPVRKSALPLSQATQKKLVVEQVKTQSPL